MTDKPPLRAAIVGTGYIADFHAKAIRAHPGVELVAVADPNLRAAEAFAAGYGVPAYPSLAAMAAAHPIDAAHLLAPPDFHHALAREALAAGWHVMVEKPMTVTVADAIDLVAAGEAAGRIVRVNHSMVFGESFVRLREHVRNGDIGPVDHLGFDHFAELAFIRFGPFTNWMLREPGNALLEIGSHPISGMIDLVGEPDTIEATADRDVILPGGARAYRRWRIRATAGRTAVDINLDLGPGFGQRTVTARGALGSITADLDADTCVLDRRTRRGIDFDRHARSLDQAAQLRRQARHTLGDYLLSKAKLRQRGNPYEKSILDSVAAFYAELQGAPADSRITAATGRAVVETCRRVIDAARLKGNEPARVAAAAAVSGDTPEGVSPPIPTGDTPSGVSPSTARATPPQPSVLVIGGTGFIGKRLVRQLLDKGVAVRVAARSTSPALAELGGDRLQTARVDLRSPADLEAALDGIDTVYHLATTGAKTWPQFQEQEVEPTRLLGEACLARGVKRLIYTGTIDSYYAGKGAGTITENTPLDPRIDGRNYYARAKAAGERVLTALHRTRGLPLVIARPGIVIGEGGNPFHWGVGRWLSEGVVATWGDGDNKLPFVLVDDVAAGLVLAGERPDVEGRSFNFIDLPLLSGNDYLDELQRLTAMRIDVEHRPIWRYWLDDLSKWPPKVALGHPDASRRPSYHDWESRTQKAFFDCARTRAELGWQPASDRQRIVDEGIGGSLKAWLAARG